MPAIALALRSPGPRSRDGGLQALRSSPPNRCDPRGTERGRIRASGRSYPRREMQDRHEATSQATKSGGRRRRRSSGRGRATRRMMSGRRWSRGSANAAPRLSARYEHRPPFDPGKSTGVYIDATFQLRQQLYTPLICVVTHGEIWSLARENGWGQAKRLALEVMLSNLVTVDINVDQVFDAYVDVEEASRKARGGAVNLGKNDLWIAAVTKVTGATLLSCDKDFDHLDPGQISRIYIDPNSALPPPPAGQTP